MQSRTEFKRVTKVNPRARRIIIKVRPSLVELIVPKGVPLSKAEEFFDSKKDWIENRLAELEKIENKYFLFGQEVFPAIENGVLKIYKSKYPGFIPSERLTLIFEEYLFNFAKSYIPQRVRKIAYLHNFKFNNVKVKKLKSRWGSCSVRKNLSFNYLLLKNSKRAIDYVIIHELCHTLEMNHSKRFWDLVGRIMPDYKKVKKDLKSFYVA